MASFRRNPSLLPALCALATVLWAPAAAADEPRWQRWEEPAGTGARPPLRRLDEAEDAHVPTVFARDGWPLAGYHGNRFYLRDEHGRFQFFPGFLLQVDGKGAFGKGTRDIGGVPGGVLQPRVEIRRARLQLGGSVLGKVAFLLSADLGQRPQLASTYIDGEIHRWLHASVGLQPVPHGMENRSVIYSLSWLERTLTSRFAMGDRLDTGALLWGETKRRAFTYEVGAFSGEGRNHAESDGRVDGAARITVRPLAFTGGIASRIHVGFSGRLGLRRSLRDTQDVGTLSTDGGWTFFSPTRKGTDGKVTRILTSGAQRSVAGEVRVPVSRLDLRFEFVALSKGTRETESGQEIVSSERFGTLVGSAFYAQLGFWILGSPAVPIAQPGVFRPPAALSFPQGDRHVAPHALEALARVESLSLTYRANDRERRANEAPREERVRVTVLGAGLRYWATVHASLFLSYTLNLFPESGSPANTAATPGNVAGAHTLHEVGLRAQTTF